MADLPGGTVTFLFMDIEGSIRLLQELRREGYARALVGHERLEALVLVVGSTLQTRSSSVSATQWTSPLRRGSPGRGSVVATALR